MRPFQLIRDEDETGVSGTGVVAEGIIYSDGHVSLRWVVGQHRSTVAYDSIEAVEAIHGHGGRTRVEHGLNAADTLRYAAQLIPSAYQHGDSPSAWLTRRADELE